ncbi:MAG: hypothetical protein KAX18_06900 [Candidatus Lokiarchaeota archaeon]|nr:hypothetical protein [Candidatus Lokiarchaeota archaeon]
MSGKKYDNFGYFITDAQKEIKELVNKRNQLNNKIKRYIKSFQMAEYEIYKSLFNTKEYYNKKRYYSTKKIRKLRRKVLEYEDILDFLITERNKLKKPDLNRNLLNLIKCLDNSIKEINYRINSFNKKIKNHILRIEEEIYIVEKISKLEKKKQKRVKLLSELKKVKITELQSTEYYEVDSRIKLFETMLKEINRDLIKWSNKRKNYHKKMLDLYREAKEFRNFKKEMENKLKENKDTADHYYQHYLEIMNQNERDIINKIWFKPKAKPQLRELITPRLESIITRKKMFKQFKNERLAIALEKQKLGKKLDFYEFKLILDQPKK